MSPLDLLERPVPGWQAEIEAASPARPLVVPRWRPYRCRRLRRTRVRSPKVGVSRWWRRFSRDIAFVQQAQGTANNTSTLTVTLSSTVAGHIVIVYILVATRTVTGVTDNAGTPNTYGQDAVQTFGSGTLSLYTYSGQQAQTATTITVTFNTFARACACAAEYSGIATSSAKDATASTFDDSTTNTTPDSGATATLSQSSELVTGCIGDLGVSTAVTLDGSLTALTTSSIPVLGERLTPGYKIVAATTAVHFQGTGLASGNQWGAEVVTYKGGSIAYTRSIATTLTPSTVLGRQAAYPRAMSTSTTPSNVLQRFRMRAIATTITVSTALARSTTAARAISSSVTVSTAFSRLKQSGRSLLTSVTVSTAFGRVKISYPHIKLGPMVKVGRAYLTRVGGAFRTKVGG